VQEVPHDIVEARPADVPRSEDDAYHAALVRDGARLDVVDVAPVFERTKDSG
jgi:hypothetical protein